MYIITNNSNTNMHLLIDSHMILYYTECLHIWVGWWGLASTDRWPKLLLYITVYSLVGWRLLCTDRTWCGMTHVVSQQNIPRTWCGSWADRKTRKIYIHEKHPKLLCLPGNKWRINMPMPLRGDLIYFHSIIRPNRWPIQCASSIYPSPAPTTKHDTCAYKILNASFGLLSEQTCAMLWITNMIDTSICRILFFNK